MRIGGLQKNTLIDYPGKIGTVIFTTACNFRCPFCYATELVLPQKIKKQPQISEDYFFSFLKGKKGMIEGVVICGGEPTLQKDLLLFIKKIKKLGFLVKLDTNGYLPNILEKIIKGKLVDYIAMDIKASKEKYKKYVGKNLEISKIEKSIKLLSSKGNTINYEFRTTLAPGIKKEDILKIVKWIRKLNKKNSTEKPKYFLQEFSGTKEIINPKIKDLPVLKKEEIKEIIKKITPNFVICKLR